MKKSLIALAALSAFATAAQAQSSVTIYGILDTGYRDQEAKISIGADGGSVKSRDLGMSNQQTSRWGIRGTEDLGGGLRAGFQLEAGMSLDSSGATAGTDKAVAATNTLGSRPTFVSLSSAKLGEVRAGRQDTSLHASVGRFNTGGQNNMPGSIYSPFASTLLVDNAAADGDLDFLTSSGATAAGLGSYARTVDKAVTYTSPVINGFQAQLMIGDGKDTARLNDGADTLNATEKRKQTSYSLNYKAGNFEAGYAYHQSKVDGTAAATISSSAFAANATAKVTTDHLGASYDFGSAKAFAQYITNKAESATATTHDNKATEVGVRVPVGKTLVWASYVDGERKFGSNKYDQKGYQLGASYSLSKRTNLYAIYGDQELKGTGSVSTVKMTEEAVAAGIRHTF
jgi:predicted porin